MLRFVLRRFEVASSEYHDVLKTSIVHFKAILSDFRLVVGLLNPHSIPMLNAASSQYLSWICPYVSSFFFFLVGIFEIVFLAFMLFVR